jgi:hypothetical protein
VTRLDALGNALASGVVVAATCWIFGEAAPKITEAARRNEAVADRIEMAVEKLNACHAELIAGLEEERKRDVKYTLMMEGARATALRQHADLLLQIRSMQTAVKGENK